MCLGNGLVAKRTAHVMGLLRLLAVPPAHREPFHFRNSCVRYAIWYVPVASFSHGTAKNAGRIVGGGTVIVTQQAPAPPPPPGWQPPKQGHKLRNISLGCAGLIVVIIILVAGAAQTNNGTKIGSTNGSSATSNGSGSGPQKFKVGDIIKVGDQTVTVNSVKAQAPSGNPYITPGTGNQYVLVSVTFTNNGSAAAPVSSAVSFSLHDSTGQAYQETILPDQPQPPDGSVSPADKLTGTLVYAAPKGQALSLYFKNDLFSAGEVIIDLGTPIAS